MLTANRRRSANVVARSSWPARRSAIRSSKCRRCARRWTNTGSTAAAAPAAAAVERRGESRRGVRLGRHEDRVEPVAQALQHVGRGEDRPEGAREVTEQQIASQKDAALKEIEGQRSFPILIGIFEATSIDRRVKGFPSPRPLTHDLIVNVVENLGGQLQDVVISELKDHTYIAKLRVRSGGEQFQRSSKSVPRSLKKQFQAARVPAWQRGGPLVYGEGRLLFVPGLGIDLGTLFIRVAERDGNRGIGR